MAHLSYKNLFILIISQFNIIGKKKSTKILSYHKTNKIRIFIISQAGREKVRHKKPKFLICDNAPGKNVVQKITSEKDIIKKIN